MIYTVMEVGNKTATAVPINLKTAAMMAEHYANVLDTSVKNSIEKGESFASIARQIGRTEAAVRLKAKRKGWKHPVKTRGV